MQLPSRSKRKELSRLLVKLDPKIIGDSRGFAKLSPKIADQRYVPMKLDFEIVNLRLSSANLDCVVCAPRLQIFDVDLKASDRHGELSALLILLGADFGYGERRSIDNIARRQADRAVMHEGNKRKHQ